MSRHASFPGNLAAFLSSLIPSCFFSWAAPFRSSFPNFVVVIFTSVPGGDFLSKGGKWKTA